MTCMAMDEQVADLKIVRSSCAQISFIATALI